MTLIAVTGYKNSGKNAVCNVLESEYEFKITGFADALKEQMYILNPIVLVSTALTTGVWTLRDVVDQFGWDVAKEKVPEVRRLLQIGGTEAGRNIFGQNIWAETWYKRTKVWLEQGYDVCVSDMRFLNEAAFARELDGQVWRVIRPGTGPGEHASEKELNEIEPDYIIRNDRSLEDLTDVVKNLMTL